MTWDVLRDDDGAPITLTPAQVAAVWHAIRVRDEVMRAEGHDPSEPASAFNRPNLAKSRLLGRMLIDGRPPLVVKPPMSIAGCDYQSVEPDLPHYYLGQVFLVTLEPPRPRP